MASTIGIVNAAWRSFLLVRAECKAANAQPSRQSTSDDLAATGIENDHKIAESMGNPNVGEVGNPDHVGSVRDHIAVKVWINRGIVAAIDRARIAFPMLHPQSGSNHYPRRPSCDRPIVRGGAARESPAGSLASLMKKMRSLGFFIIVIRY